MTNGEAFSIGEAIGVGWKEVTGSLGLWLVATVIVIAASVIPDLLVELLGGWTSPVGALVGIAGWLLYFFVIIGFIDMSLRAVDGRPVSVGGLFARGDCVLAYVVSSIIFMIAMMVGLVLLVIPGLIVLAMWYFYGWSIVGEGVGGVESLGRSAALTKGYRMQVFLFGLALIGVNLLGFLALLVGVLVTVPLSMVASAHVYRRLEAAQETVHQQAPAPGGFSDPVGA